MGESTVPAASVPKEGGDQKQTGVSEQSGTGTTDQGKEVKQSDATPNQNQFALEEALMREFDRNLGGIRSLWPEIREYLVSNRGIGLVKGLLGEHYRRHPEAKQ